MAARSCSDRLASRFSVILLFSGESPLGSSSALELSMLGLVSVMSSLLAVNADGSGGSWPPKNAPPPNMEDKEPWTGQVLALSLKPEVRPQLREVLPAKPSSPSSKPRDLELSNALLPLGAQHGHNGSF